MPGYQVDAVGVLIPFSGRRIVFVPDDSTQNLQLSAKTLRKGQL